MTNPLLLDSDLAFEAIDFSRIEVEHFLPALDIAIKEAKNNLDKIKQQNEISFDNILLAEESAADRLDLISSIFFALYSSHCSDELSEISQEFNSRITSYSSDVSLDAELFDKINQLYQQKEQLDLTQEQSQVLEKTFKSYTRNGALLNDEDKQTLREIDQQLARLSLEFSENIRKATNDYHLHVEDADQLAGLPENNIKQAAQVAKENGYDSGYLFTLDFPSYYPFMQYCSNRKLRKTLWQAYSTRAVAGEYDNQKNILEIINLRQQRAKLLGYKDYQDYVLEQRMAQTPKRVNDFIHQLYEKALPKAQQELKQLQQLNQQIYQDDIKKYDAAFISEKLKKQLLNFDDESLRPYFQLNNVINGLFQTLNKLYGIKFTEMPEIPVYHQDVRVFKVTDAKDNYLGLLYSDFFPRAEKRPGAWMTTFRNQGYQFNEIKRPFVSIVCNFTKPTDEQPSLLSLNEVLTLFHEMGHALHALLSKVSYKSIAGTRVYWDFVELPSQIMENWVVEKECLDLFARHYKTGESIPQKWLDKLIENRQFLQGLATLRQLSLANLDMQWHKLNQQFNGDVIAFEKTVMKGYDLYPEESGTNMSCSFSHIFAGGYACGYYSYKWAEVLDADAFALFKKSGIFDTSTANKFRQSILEKGGSEDPMQLYIGFKGSEPDIQALLDKAGLNYTRDI
ncbi:MAG: M3 family metallopeptidase [Gammaproteobacteria bacterium]|nr:M3 family metallopeptidase [Gammaproteobacteria bacterium]